MSELVKYSRMNFYRFSWKPALDSIFGIVKRPTSNFSGVQLIKYDFSPCYGPFRQILKLFLFSSTIDQTLTSIFT